MVYDILKKPSPSGRRLSGQQRAIYCNAGVEANKHIIFVRYHIVLRRYENKLNADLQSFVLKFSKIMVKIQLSALKPKQYGVKF